MEEAVGEDKDAPATGGGGGAPATVVWTGWRPGGGVASRRRGSVEVAGQRRRGGVEAASGRRGGVEAASGWRGSVEVAWPRRWERRGEGDLGREQGGGGVLTRENIARARGGRRWLESRKKGPSRPFQWLGGVW